MKKGIFLCFLCLSCSKNKTEPSVPPVGLAGTAQIAPRLVNHVKVDEVITRDQFSYVRSGDIWFALVGVSLHVGQKIKIEEQAVFEDFQSKTLNRIFKKIIFGKPQGLKPANDPKPIEPH